MAAPRSLAVVSRRSEPPDSLDYFPTPPWATRALFEYIARPMPSAQTAADPACGEGHMAAVLAEYFGRVEAADVFDYGYGAVRDYLTVGMGDAAPVDWIITNPPFNKAEAFLRQAMQDAKAGVALLLRSVWMHGIGRYEGVFRHTPPAIIAPFAERVPMVKGRWDPAATTATDYCWFVWVKRPVGGWAALSSVFWIPPGCRKGLTKPGDLDRFAAKAPVPLIDGGAA